MTYREQRAIKHLSTIGLSKVKIGAILDYGRKTIAKALREPQRLKDKDEKLVHREVA